MTKLIDITGKAISGEWGNDDETGEGIPVLRTTNFTNEGIVDYKNVVTRNITKKNISEKYLKHGDIIVEKSGGSDKQPVGRVIYFEGEEDKFLFNNFTGLLRVQNTKEWYPKYVFYSMFSNYNKGGTRRFQNKTTGLHNLQIDRYVNELCLKKVELEKQVKCCEILDKIKAIIDYRKRQIEELDILIKSRFVEMFGDPVHNPFAWNIKPFLECGSCKNGMNFGAGETGVELQYLGVGDFKNLTKIEEVTKLGQVCLNKMPSEDYMLKNGDIVFVRSNGNKALVGRCLAVYPNGTPITYSGFCIRYRKTDESLEIPYLLQVLKTESMRLMMAGRGANIQNLNQQILGQLQIPIPPKDLQREFGQFINQVDKLKFGVHKSLDETQELFDSLMQMYFE